MARLSAAVMAHPSRAEMVEELCAALDRKVPVVWDQRSDRWDTGRRSLLAYDPAATHHLVVQDDAVVCRDLIGGLERALDFVPEGHPVSCYVGRVRPYAQRVEQAVRRAGRVCSWIVMRDLFWGVAVVVPTHLIDELVRAQDRAIHIAEYDRRISRWFISRGTPTWYCWPSIVSHRVGPSLVGHGDARQAHRFVGTDVSAADLDWSRPALRVPDPKTTHQQLPMRVAAKPRPPLPRGGIRA
jgi:hypothetical protein